MNTITKVLLIGAGIGTTALLVRQAIAINRPVPPQTHLDIVNRLKVYYPWKVLRKEFVFVGKEAGYPETTWLCLYDDGTNMDVAAVLVIYEGPDRYTLTFSRQDAGNGEQLSVDIEGIGTFTAIFTAPDTLPGLTAIDIMK